MPAVFDGSFDCPESLPETKGSVEKGDNRFSYPKRSKVNEAFSL